MMPKTFEHIKKHIHLLEIDYENGVVINRKSFLNTKNKKLGYLCVALNYKRVTVHNLIVFLKYKEKSIGLVVNHIDGNKLNNKPENLEMVTQSENMIHAYKLGLVRTDLALKGEEHHMTKITKKDSKDIKILLDKGVKVCEIARKYGVNRNLIGDIKSNKHWSCK